MSRDPSDHRTASEHAATILPADAELAPFFPHDATFLAAVQDDFARWESQRLGVPDLLDALNEFQPQQHRVDGLGHLVVFPMYTQNGSSSRLMEAVLVETVWPEFVAALVSGTTTTHCSSRCGSSTSRWATPRTRRYSPQSGRHAGDLDAHVATPGGRLPSLT